METQEQVIELRDILHILLNRSWIIVLMVIIITTTTMAVSYFIIDEVYGDQHC